MAIKWLLLQLKAIEYVKVQLQDSLFGLMIIEELFYSIVELIDQNYKDSVLANSKFLED